MKNKNVLITGATGGIGEEIADLFCEEEYGVFAIGNKNERSFISQTKFINYCQCDFGNDKQLSDFCNDLRDRQIDILINCAGINIIKPIKDVSWADYEQLMNINLKAPILISKAVWPNLEMNGGKIVNIGSIWSKISKEGRSLYTASKNALAGFTQTLALEGAPYNILVNCVSPGFVDTELTKRSLNEQERKDIISKIPLNRMASPKEIAKLVYFLASDENTYITGQNIVIDGGFTIQ